MNYKKSTNLLLLLQLALLLVSYKSIRISAFVPSSSSSSLQATITGWTRQSPRSSLSIVFETSSSSSNDKEFSSIPTEWQGQVLQKLKKVIDPDLNADIVTLGFVKNLQLDQDTRTVAFDVELTTPACPVKDQFAMDCDRLVRSLDWVKDVRVSMTAQPSVSETNTLGLAQVGAIIAVSSCKGGVGKSTTAVNLAYSLQVQGASVGILDADVYGPSLPTMIKPDDDVVRFVGRQIAPLQRNGVKLMSFGYVNDGSAIMRGPMVTQLLDQFLSVIHWGALDYLILDLPPGTGDIQLTLTQRLNITAAVIVTTPQELSFADVVRGVEMFDSVNVPCVAVVENMAYYEIEKSNNNAPIKVDQAQLQAAFKEKIIESGIELNGAIDSFAKSLVDIVVQHQQTTATPDNKSSSTTERVQIFGKGHRQRLSEQWGIEHTFSVPLLDRIAANGDSGTPFVLEHPNSPQAQIYADLARAVVSEVAKAKYQAQTRPGIVYNSDEHYIKVDDDDEIMSPADLRRICRCASCVEELTGKQILVPSMVPETIKPLSMSSTGNYALSVNWSDGHRSLYPYRQIRAHLQARKEQLQKQKATMPLQADDAAKATVMKTTTNNAVREKANV